MIKYRSKVEYLLDVLEKHNNKINSSKIINEIFNDLYRGHNLAFVNSEYTLIIRHISTPWLRKYFDKLAKDHNYKLSLNKRKKVKDVELKLILDKDLILDREEQKNIFDRLSFLESEFDEVGNYVGIHPERPTIKTKSILHTKNFIKGRRGQRIYHDCSCSLCSMRFDYGWKYIIDENIVFLCDNCKAKVRAGQFFHLIYTPMK